MNKKPTSRIVKNGKVLYRSVRCICWQLSCCVMNVYYKKHTSSKPNTNCLKKTCILWLQSTPDVTVGTSTNNPRLARHSMLLIHNNCCRVVKYTKTDVTPVRITIYSNNVDPWLSGQQEKTCVIIISNTHHTHARTEVTKRKKKFILKKYVSVMLQSPTHLYPPLTLHKRLPQKCASYS